MSGASVTCSPALSLACENDLDALVVLRYACCIVPDITSHYPGPPRHPNCTQIDETTPPQLVAESYRPFRVYWDLSERVFDVHILNENARSFLEHDP